MTNKKIPHIRIPKSLMEHPIVENAPHPQHKLLMTILNRAAFKPCKINDHQHIINLEAGQLCTTLRQLAEWAKIDKNDVERGLKRFSKAEILRQEVRHTKTIITIIYPDTCDLIKSASETEKETKVRQERDKSETQKKKIKKIKKINKPPPPTPKSEQEPKNEELVVEEEKINKLLESLKNLPFTLHEANTLMLIRKFSRKTVHESIYEMLNRNRDGIIHPDRFLEKICEDMQNLETFKITRIENAKNAC